MSFARRDQEFSTGDQEWSTRDQKIRSVNIFSPELLIFCLMPSGLHTAIEAQGMLDPLFDRRVRMKQPLHRS
jgi:hypothetical protein